MATLTFGDIEKHVESLVAPPEDFLRSEFEAAVKVANAGVNGTFFGEAGKLDIPGISAAQKKEMSDFSIRYACFILSLTSRWGFNKTIKNISYNDIAQQVDAFSNPIGNLLFLKYMMQKDELKPAFADPEQAARLVLQNRGRTDQFDLFVIRLQHNPHSHSIFPAKVYLLLLSHWDPGFRTTHALLDNWRKSAYWHATGVDNWDKIQWFHELAPGMNQNGPFYSALNGGVSRAVNSNYSRTGPGHRECAPGSSLQTGASPCYNVPGKTTTYYGSGVYGWIKSPTGAASLGLYSGHGPDNVKSSGGGGGCVLAGVRVLTEAGEWVPVEEITPGTRVVNGSGGISTVAGDIVVNPAVTGVYGLNGGAAFISRDHAVMTQRGWCSVDPEATRALLPHLRVGMLQVGDVVWKWRKSALGSRDICDLEVVREISHHEVAEEEARPGYTLRLEDGERSIWTDGYCTLLDYPELTTRQLARNIDGNLQLAEQVKLSEALRGAAPMLEKAFGKPVIDATLKMLADPQARAGRGRGQPTPLKPDLDDLVHPRMEAVAVESDRPLSGDLAHMSMMNGRLFIAGKPVNSHQEGQHLSWTRMDSNGRREHGKLRFSDDLSEAHGVIQSNGAATPVSVYTRLTFDTHYVDVHHKKIPWYTFVWGYKIDPQGAKVRYGELLDAHGQPLDPKHVSVTFGVTKPDKNGWRRLTVDIEWSNNFLAWTNGKWKSATIEFAANFRDFTGHLYEYDQNKPLHRGLGYTLLGTYKDVGAMAPMIDGLTQEHLSAPIDTALLELPVEGNAPDAELAPAIAIDIGATSVEALYMLPTPDLANLHRDNFATLQNMMIFALPEDQLKWFGETQQGAGDQLTVTEKGLANQAIVRTFLRDRFAMASLGQAFAGAKDAKIKQMYASVGDWKSRLDYYWQGGGPGCLSQDKGYTAAMAEITRENYIRMMPGLKPYLTNGKTWAPKLYKYCLQPDNIRSLAAQTTTAGSARLTNLVTMLDALDPDKVVPLKGEGKASYATALYRAILDERLKTVRTNFKPSQNRKTTEDLLKQFLRQYFAMVKAGNLKWSPAAQAQAEKDLAAALKELEAEDENALVERLGASVSSLTEIMHELRGAPMTRQLKAWAEANPRIAKVCGVAMLGASFAVSMAVVVEAAMHWKEMRTSEKVQAITDIVDGVSQLFANFADYMKAKNVTDPDSETPAAQRDGIELQQRNDGQSVVEVADNRANAEQAERSGRGGGEETPAPDTSLENFGRSGAESITGEGSVAEAGKVWSNIADVSEAFADFMGILALGVACWATGEEIANDFKTGQPAAIKALDILQEAANATCLVIAAGSTIYALAAGEEVASFIPVVGIVIAIVGIIFAFVLEFIHRKPEPTAAEVFVQDKIVPFLRGLSTPPLAWKEQWLKAHRHLEGPEKVIV